MFIVDQAPDRVTATPAASAHLHALAAQRGQVTVLLTDRGAEVLPEGRALPSGSVRLGRLDDGVTFAGDTTAQTAWWRNRAEIDLRDHDVTVAVTPLSEDEVFAALASGPLPRI
jgi:hypothetical protein